MAENRTDDITPAGGDSAPEPAAPRQLERRCPRLGGLVDFTYCRTPADGDLPCGKVFDCWWEAFDVVGYFRRELDPEQFDRLAALRPKPKITSILEIVEQAKKRLND